MGTRYIANRALWVITFRNTAKSLIRLLRMIKLKTKYNVLAQYKLEDVPLSTAIHAVYKPLVILIFKRWNLRSYL